MKYGLGPLAILKFELPAGSTVPKDSGGTRVESARMGS